MEREARDDRLISQLKLMLVMAGAKPWRWMLSAVAISLVLAALDTLGVAAMVPLTQLISGTATDTGALGVISGIIGTTEPSVLIPVVAAGIVVLFVVKSIAAIAFRWWLLGRTTRVSALAATNLMSRYMLSPYATHRSRRMSEVYRNINDSTGQAASVLLATLSVLTDVMLLAAIVVVLAITAPLVTLFTVLLFAVLVGGLQRSLRSSQSKLGEEIADASLEAWQFLMPALDGFREARLTSSARAFVAGFERAKLRGANAARHLAIIVEMPRYALEIGFTVAIGGIALLLFTTVTPAEALTILGVFAAASLRGLPTLIRVSANIATIRSGRIGLRIVSRVVDELDAERQHDEAPRGGVPYDGDIAIRNVSFHYPDSEQLVLDDVSLVVPRNKTTAFVGSSGAGKSTLLDLLLGLLEPTSGSIECGGRSILDDRATWYSGLGVVPQDVFLVNDTLAANIAFGVSAEAIDRERVAEVIEMAQLTALIAELPDGLDTVVGERGVRLSGGQRQRLGLARALYRRPSTLILDEATSALDNVTEHEITETLDQLSGDLTIVIVAHRLSTVRGADSIVFMKDGRVEARGTFDEVRSTNQDFARLVELGDLS